MRRSPALAVLTAALVLLVAATGWTKDDPKGEAQLDPGAQDRVLISDIDLQIVKLRSTVANLETKIFPIQQNLGNEIEQRDLIVLRQRFVEGKEFFFKTQNFKVASEVMYGVCNHPLVNRMPNYDEALYMLGESLFQTGRHSASREYFERLIGMGQDNPYAVPALLRLIEIDLALKDYSAADEHHKALISAASTEGDGGLGLYLIAKGHYQQGGLDTSVEVLSKVQPDQKYWAEAQYFTGVVLLKKGDLDAATAQFESLLTAIKGDPMGRERVVADTNMALGRIYYSKGEFGRAMQHYSAVPKGSEEYRRAQYETMWVYVTRNDAILAQLTSERSKQMEIQSAYDSVYASMLNLPPKEDLSQYEEQLRELDAEIKAMDEVFNQIEASLVRLEGEALQSFNAVISSDPHSPLIPEAELLIGNVYAQVEDFQAAEDWYKSLQAKYRQLGGDLRASRRALSGDYGRIQLVEQGRSYDQAEPAPQASPMPVNVAVWVARDPRVRRVYMDLKRIDTLRSDLEEARALASEVSGLIDSLQTGDSYPILTMTYDQLKSVEVDARAALSNVAELRGSASGVKDPNERTRLLNDLNQEENRLLDLLTQVSQLQAAVENKKDETIRQYRGTLAELRGPLDRLAAATEALGGELTSTTASEVDGALDEIERDVDDTALAAGIGILDVTYRWTKEDDREIRRIQLKQQEEIREFKLNYRRTLQKSQEEEDGSK